MADNTTTSEVVAGSSPALSQDDVNATQQLLESLYTFGKKPGDDPKVGKLLRHTDHTVPLARHGTSTTSHDGVDGQGGDESSAVKITSWKMQDYAYKRDPCPYPTRARGLFTRGRERIVARAYDKFFNVDEVSWTKWDNLPDLTAPPYHLTLKSNGCLILIAALTPDTLLVTSKHAVGQSKSGETAMASDKGKEVAAESEDSQANGGLVDDNGQRITSHALVGELWLDRGLRRVGLTRKDLAQRLWNENWTLVAELCDDNFEEHILPYAADKSGLHLHGIVFNHPTLLTLSPQTVNEVAEAYGLIPTPFITLSSVAEVRKLTDEIAAKDGTWQGQHVEGFVVRAALKEGSLDKQPQPHDLTEENWNDERRVFMWKIKFDQPYLMWREWRELTKKLLSAKKKAGDDVARRGREKLRAQQKTSTTTRRGTLEEEFKAACLAHPFDAPKRPSTAAPVTKTIIDEGEEDDANVDGGTTPEKSNKGKMAAKDESEGDASGIRLDRVRNPMSRLYVTWLEMHTKDHPEDFAHYMDNRGIIAVREKFFAWKDGTEEGRKSEREVLNRGGKGGKNAIPAKPSKEGKIERTILVPIAVPGTGKTLLGVALSRLFGFAHTQSDDILEKRAAKHFEANVAKLVETSPVVFADKNNHLKQHREAMVTIARKSKRNVRLVALLWPLDNLPHNEIHRICADRIVARGENHQSLRPVRTGEHEVILSRFFSQYEEFDNAFNTGSDAEFDHVIHYNISWDIEKVLEHTIEQLLEIDAKALDDASKIPGLRRPSKDEMHEAIAVAKGYKPQVYKEMKLESLDPSAKRGGSNKGARYYGIAVEVDIQSLLARYFDAVDGEADNFFLQLREKGRIEKKPHVTLIHERELEAPPEPTSGSTEELEFCKELWERCKKISQLWGEESITVTLTLGPTLAYDGRSMSIQVSNLAYSGLNLDPRIIPSDKRKDSYHITVGTANNEIRPVEGKWLLEAALKGEQVSQPGEKIRTLQIEPVEVKGRVKGML